MEKLLKVISELKAPKNQLNKFGGYHYRSCEDILEAVKPLLHKHGLLMTITDNIVSEGGRVYVQANITVTDGEWVRTASAFAREAEHKKGMDDAQVTGSASSYARKYALNGMFLIDDTKDSDTEKPKEEDKSESERNKVLEQASELLRKVKLPEDKRQYLKKEYKKVSTLEDAVLFLKLAEKEAKASDLVSLAFGEKEEKEEKEVIGKQIDIF